MNKTIIGIISCGKNTARRNACWDAFVKDIPTTVDYKFFVGGMVNEEEKSDVISLNCDDTFLGLPKKIKEFYQWALTNNYDLIIKADDDSLILNFDKLITINNEFFNCNYENNWLRGNIYIISNNIAKILINTMQTNSIGEETNLHNVLKLNNITLQHNPDFVYNFNFVHGNYSKEYISVHSVKPEQMLVIYNKFKGNEIKPPIITKPLLYSGPKPLIIQSVTEAVTSKQRYEAMVRNGAVKENAVVLNIQYYLYTILKTK